MPLIGSADWHATKEIAAATATTAGKSRRTLARRIAQASKTRTNVAPIDAILTNAIAVLGLFQSNFLRVYLLEQ
jgi:hypothetical protein